MDLALAHDRALRAQQEQDGVVQRSVMRRPGAGGGPAGRSRARRSALAHAGSALTGASCTAWTSTSWYACRLLHCVLITSSRLVVTVLAEPADQLPYVAQTSLKNLPLRLHGAGTPRVNATQDWLCRTLTILMRRCRCARRTWTPWKQWWAWSRSAMSTRRRPAPSRSTACGACCAWRSWRPSTCCTSRTASPPSAASCGWALSQPVVPLRTHILVLVAHRLGKACVQHAQRQQSATECPMHAHKPLQSERCWYICV